MLEGFQKSLNTHETKPPRSPVRGMIGRLAWHRAPRREPPPRKEAASARELGDASSMTNNASGVEISKRLVLINTTSSLVARISERHGAPLDAPVPARQHQRRGVLPLPRDRRLGDLCADLHRVPHRRRGALRRRGVRSRGRRRGHSHRLLDGAGPHRSGAALCRSRIGVRCRHRSCSSRFQKGGSAKHG